MMTIRSPPRAASGCRTSSRPISRCWPRRTTTPRRGRARDLCAGRRHPRPVGAEGARRVERAQRRQGPGAGRTGAQGAGPRQADQRPARRAEQRAAPRTRATKMSSRRPRRRSTSCAPIATRSAQEINRRFPSYAELIDPKPPTRRADQGDAAPRRGDAVVLFRPGRQFRLGGAEGRAGRVRGDQGDRRRHRKQGAQAARGAGAAGGDDLRHSAVRSRARARTLFAAAQAGRGGLEVVEEPDRRHQRRARACCRCRCCRPRPRRLPPTTTLLFASYSDGALAGAHATRSPWCRRRRRCARCGNCRRASRHAAS